MEGGSVTEYDTPEQIPVRTPPWKQQISFRGVIPGKMIEGVDCGEGEAGSDGRGKGKKGRVCLVVCSVVGKTIHTGIY
ncbi:hypothetical protein Hanom_Chr02g00176471 [Helianthus anomalus]